MKLPIHKPLIQFPAPRLMGLVLAFWVTACHDEKDAALRLIEEKGTEANADALAEALRKGNLELAKAMLVLEVDPNARGPEGETPLILAAGGDASHLVPLLLEKGADMGAVDESGKTALAHAIENGNLDAVVRLLDAGASPWGQHGYEGSLVAQAMKDGRVAAAGLLLEAGAFPDSKDGEGKSLVRISIEKNQGALFEDLLEKGANLQEGRRPGVGDLVDLPHVALEHGRDEMLAALLEKGMNVNAVNHAGESLVISAVKSGRVQLLKVLKKFDVDFGAVDSRARSAVRLAVEARDKKMLRELLASGAPVDGFASDGLTPLLAAVRTYDGDLVRALVEKGAAVNLASRHEGKAMTPVSLALRQRCLPMAAFLLEKGAKPHDELYRAAKVGGDEGLKLVKVLLEGGASHSPDRGREKDSPLALAVRSGDVGIAKALLAAGAAVGAVDPCGQGLLQVAVARGDVTMAKVLLENGADPNKPFNVELSEEFLKSIKTKGVIRWALKNSKSISPLMMASDSGNVKMAQALVAHGASTRKSTVIDKIRWWPLTFATRRVDNDMMQVMLGRKPGKTDLWIRVDLSEQRAYVFQGEKEIYKTRVSTGKKSNPTRKGKFVITNKYREWESTIYESSMPFFQRLSASDFGFHVGYVPNYPASHGCIRMPDHAARKLFTMTRVGDYVEIVP